MSAPPLARHRVPAPLRISLLYAAFGFAWIVLGDLALWLQGGVTRTALLMELGKGALFVAASALLLHVLIRREVERRQRAAAQLERVLDTAPVGIAAVSADGIVRQWNAAATALLGWTEAEACGRTARDLGLGAPFHTAGGALDIAVPDASGRNVEIRTFLSHDAATDDGRVLVFSDRRPEIEAEDALRQAHKLEAVGRLAGGVAHEFNNILTAIIGHAVLLSDRMDEADDRREHAREVHRAADRAAALTRQLLVFSGKHITRSASIDLSEMLRAMSPVINRVAGEGVQTEFVLESELWPVRCDVPQLHQLVLNLTVNAREAMHAGGALTVRTSNVHPGVARGSDPVPPGEYVLLSVEDDGGGMSADALAHLFEPFFTTKEQGTGLGLATVYGIVQQCDGHIRVRSTPGHGASFDIYFPRAPADAADPPTDGQVAPAGATLLVVEDDDAVRLLTCRVLRRHGHRVVSSRNGLEALDLLRSGEPISLVIADIVMPVMNGIELSEHIRSEFPDLPILFTSGFVADTVGAEGLDTGSHFMAKPYTPDELISRVGELLARPPGAG